MTPFGEAPPSPLGCSGDCEEFRGAVWQHIKLTNVHVAVSAADGPRLKNLGDQFWFDSVILSLCSACNSSTDKKHSTGRKEDVLQTYNQFVMWQLLFPQIPISDCLGRKKRKKERKKESGHPFPLPGYCKLWWAGGKNKQIFIFLTEMSRKEPRLSMLVMAVKTWREFAYWVEFYYDIQFLRTYF